MPNHIWYYWSFGDMSEENKSGMNWDVIWKDYSTALAKWQEVFDLFQKTTSEMQTKYNEVLEKASSESSKDTMKLFGENWFKSMNPSGTEPFKQFGENWEKAMSEYSGQAFKQFSDSWQKTLNDSALESMKTFEEMMNKFAETWKSMWPKK